MENKNSIWSWLDSLKTPRKSPTCTSSKSTQSSNSRVRCRRHRIQERAPEVARRTKPTTPARQGLRSQATASPGKQVAQKSLRAVHNAVSKLRSGGNGVRNGRIQKLSSSRASSSQSSGQHERSVSAQSDQSQQSGSSYASSTRSGSTA